MGDIYTLSGFSFFIIIFYVSLPMHNFLSLSKAVKTFTLGDCFWIYR